MISLILRVYSIIQPQRQQVHTETGRRSYASPKCCIKSILRGQENPYSAGNLYVLPRCRLALAADGRVGVSVGLRAG